MVLYVGGRAAQLPHIRQAAARSGVGLLHHDGGIEDSDAMLPGLISRVDTVMFPVDCVSHSAVSMVKRSCAQMGKRFVPLRASGITSFIAALRTDAPD